MWTGKENNNYLVSVKIKKVDYFTKVYSYDIFAVDYCTICFDFQDSIYPLRIKIHDKKCKNICNFFAFASRI